MLQKISNKCCAFELSINQNNPGKQKSLNIKQPNLTLITIRNVYWAPKQYIRLISEGSCDTEEWSNDAENSALHHINKLHLKKYILKIYSYFKLNFVLNYVEYGDAEYVLYKH